MNPAATRLARKTRQSGMAAILLTVTGFTAAFGVASCCALPLILSGLGIGSAGLAGIALIAAPHRTLLLIVSAACLGGGAVFIWRQRETSARCIDGVCSQPIVRNSTAAGLITGSVLLVLGYLYV